MSETLRCTVDRTTYRNDQSGYTVLKCHAARLNTIVTVIITMPEIHSGAVLSLEGEWEIDPKYGKQFVAEKWEETMPATANGIEKYLASGLIDGIGPVYARKIVEKFGDQTLEIIETDPDRLLEVEGVGLKRIKKLKKVGKSRRKSRMSCSFCRAMISALPLQQKCIRPTARTVSRLSRRTRTSSLMISMGLGLRRPTRSQ